MPDFRKIKMNAEQTSRISKGVIDNFIIYYGAAQDRLSNILDKKVKKYSHITSKMPKGWKDLLKSEFIAHEIFKSKGLIRKYLNHSEVNLRSRRELEFLRFQKENAWQYSFCEIVAKPHPNFFTMRDILTDEEFLLYSQGIATKIFDKSAPIHTWFILTYTNGMCRQTYGTIAYFRTLDFADIAFFASELEPAIETREDIIEHIEASPLPYSMLWSGSGIPAVRHKDHILKQVAAHYEVEDLNRDDFKKYFTIEYAEQLYRLTLKKNPQFPHSSTAYYDEITSVLHLTAATLKGFDILVKNVNSSGYNLPNEPDEMPNIGLVNTASDILKTDLSYHSFDSLFEPEEDDNPELDKLNKYLALLTETINSERKPDIPKMAEEAGIDLKRAKVLTEEALKSYERQIGNSNE